MVAAVSDFVPTKIQKGKMKKEDMGETFELELAKNIDILSNIKEEGIKKIGFKVETDKQKAIENAKKMLNFKNLDAVCLNVIDEDNSFGSDSNEIEFIDKKRVTTLSKDSKLNISLKILDLAKEL